jgi:hypothetical protein
MASISSATVSTASAASSSVTARASPPRGVDEDLPHHARGQGEEVHAVLGVHRLTDQLDERLVDQRPGGERLARAQAAQLCVRQPPQLLVGGFERLRQRGGVPAPGSGQGRGEIARHGRVR